MSTDELHRSTGESTQQVRAELVEVREALMLVPTFLTRVDGKTALSQDLLALLDREAHLMAALR